MLLILSPSTTLDFETPAPSAEHTQPVLLDEAATLVAHLQKLSTAELADLLATSDELTQLNHERYEQWTRPFTLANAKQALFAFTGATYEGLDALTMSTAVQQQAQQRLRILSGLYGVLRPLDLMQPYRLEMKTKLANPSGESLYPFWQAKVTAVLNDALNALESDILLNLASGEYSKVVQKRGLHGRVVTCDFKERRNGKYRTISYFSKKARGQMARFVLETNARSPEAVKAFAADGYRFNSALSKSNRLVFTRDPQV